MRDDLILVDTSIWIDYFRKSSNVEEQLDALLDNDRVCTSVLIVAELTQGCRSKKEIDSLMQCFLNLHQLVEEKSDWIDAGRLSFEMKKKGKPINLADCYLAIVAKKNKCEILSLDKHFTFLNQARVYKLAQELI